MWRQFYSRAYELPVSYNAFKSTLLTVAGWRSTHGLHDVDVGRKALLWRESGTGRDARAVALAHLQRYAAGSAIAVANARTAMQRYRIRNATADQLASWQHPPPDDIVEKLSNLTLRAHNAVRELCTLGGIQVEGCG